MQEFLDEEAKIAQEQDAEPSQVSAKIFEILLYQIKLTTAAEVKETDTLKTAISLMQKHKIGVVCVVDKKKKLTGILTERDIVLKGLGKGGNWEEIRIKMIMTQKPFYLHKEDPLAMALHNMHIGGYRNIPVLDENEKIFAVVTMQNVMKYLMDQFPVEIDNIPDEPFSGERVREGA